MNVDVVVVGAGIAGAAAAAELAATRRVVLIEREPLPAQHASGRSASVLSETSGYPTVCALARLSRPFFEAPPDGFVEHPLLSPRGLVWVGEADDVPELDALAARATDVAPTARRLTPAEAAELLPGFTPSALAGGAVHEPDAMSIDTAALVAGFLRLLRRRGGEVVTGAEALTLRRVGGGWDVETPSGRWQAGAVVNAAGAWVDVVAERAGLAPLGMRPLRRTAAIVPAPDTVERWPLVMDIAGRYYCEPEPGGLLISPADESPSDPVDAQPDELDVALALERVRDATGLPLRSVRRAWAGLRTFAPDRVPVLGEDPRAPGFYWLAGQGGAGIKTAPAMATLLALALDGSPPPPPTHTFGVPLDTLSPTRLL
ncbi:MAG TPA: FAD-dependent oxidoreductase [Ilumatobacter sp.]|nr:FAD-dependent oxidoreductase [Ilumatobacter sp.]